jgi:hypothetical protein
MENTAPASEIYKTVRGQIDTVSGDMGQRIIWLAIGQSFFFSGYAILATGKPALPENNTLYNMMLMVLPIIALLYTFLTFLDVLGSLIYMVYLRRYYQRAPKNDETESIYPPVHGTKLIRLFLHTSTAVLPIVFFIIWWILLSTHIHSK